MKKKILKPIIISKKKRPLNKRKFLFRGCNQMIVDCGL